MIIETNKASDRFVEVVFECNFCGKEHTLIVKNVELFKYIVLNHKVQDAFPELSPEDREKFINGMCNSCNANIYGATDDEDELAEQ